VRRLGPVAAALVLAAAAAAATATAQDPPGWNAKCGELDCRVEPVRSAWQPIEVGLDPRILRLSYESGGCKRGNGRATVTETARSIRIVVHEDEVVAIDTPDRMVACTREIRFRRLDVRLDRRVGGRRILGAGGVGGGFGQRVPRVIDLAAVDAAALLEGLGYEVRRFGARSGPVAFQSPLPGKRVRPGRAGITLGRRAFDARSLEACVDGAGLPVAPLRPARGDADAPDLELSPSGRGPRAFVALYADPGRARENAPGIRRNARRFDGVVDRLGRVTIVWVDPPEAGLRERVRSCVVGAKP
jgi:hypothetical protein